MSGKTSGLFSSYEDVWVVDGVRTPFAEYNGLLRDISPTDLGIKVIPETLIKTIEKVRPDVAVVIYNDHGLNFFLDKLPTFAVGAASEYRHADEGGREQNPERDAILANRKYRHVGGIAGLELAGFAVKQGRAPILSCA